MKESPELIAYEHSRRFEPEVKADWQAARELLAPPEWLLQFFRYIRSKFNR